LAKIGLVGAGQIGGWLARLLMGEGWAEVALYDKAPGLAKGKALDLMQGAAVAKQVARVQGSDTCDVLNGSDLLVVTAGLARQPGMSRDDLLAQNVAIFAELAEQIKKHAPNAIVIVVTNPLDVMVWVMQKLTGFPPARVIGMAGLLDSGRFALFLAEALSVSVRDVQTMVLGGHGDLMVPLLGHTTICGVFLEAWLKARGQDARFLEALVERTRQGGAEIVNLLKKGSAYAAPAEACLQMVRAIQRDECLVAPCAAMLSGQYGFRDIYAGVPVILGKEGVKSIIEVDLSDGERAAFAMSVEKVEALNKIASGLF
jgi:malate dehydrogenase